MAYIGEKPSSLRTATDLTVQDDLVVNNATAINNSSFLESEKLRVTGTGGSLALDPGDFFSHSVALFENDGDTTVTVASDSASNGLIRFTDVDGNSGEINYDHTDDSMAFSTNGSEAVKIESDGVVLITAGRVRINGNNIGGELITIDDDAVGSVTPPRNGGFALVTVGGSSNFPQPQDTAFLYYDVGSSVSMVNVSSGTGISASADVDAGATYTGTTGVDGRVTYVANTNSITIENRSAASRDFVITFL